MITTYITATEANYYYPQDSQYSVAQKAQALSDSFGLVNSYIGGRLKLPAVAPWDGGTSVQAPHVLKVLQSGFYRWLLLTMNNGYTEELADEEARLLERCAGIQQSEIIVPGQQTTELDAGWHVTEYSCTDNKGGVEVRGTAPLLRWYYTLTITSLTTKYPADITFDVNRDDQAAARETDVAASADGFVSVDGSMFEVRFTGQWKAGDTVQVRGVPAASVNAERKSSGIVQSPISYIR